MLLISSDNELRELQRAWCRGKEKAAPEAAGSSSPGKVRAGPVPSLSARSLPAWRGTARPVMHLPAGPPLKAEVSRRPEGG